MEKDNRLVALITGASRGIGKAIAMELATRGITIIGTATTQSGAEQISEYLKLKKADGVGMELDVSAGESIERLFSNIREKFKEPTILVNNAGITKDNLLMRMKDDEWQSVIDINLGSMFRVTKLCLRAMTKAKWGRVVNISSVVGSSGNPGQTNYAASKAGIEGFTRSLAKEIGSRGITVNSVAPGFIETDMTSTLGGEQAQKLLSQVPLRRLGKPEEIASVVSFLVSEEASYITGETIHVNGGMYMA